jgi:hypothetical protein
VQYFNLRSCNRLYLLVLSFCVCCIPAQCKIVDEQSLHKYSAASVQGESGRKADHAAASFRILFNDSYLIDYPSIHDSVIPVSNSTFTYNASFKHCEGEAPAFSLWAEKDEPRVRVSDYHHESYRPDPIIKTPLFPKSTHDSIPEASRVNLSAFGIHGRSMKAFLNDNVEFHHHEMARDAIAKASESINHRLTAHVPADTRTWYYDSGGAY